MPKSERLDQAMVLRTLVTSRSAAQALIISGEVLVNGQQVDKPSYSVKPEDTVALKHARKYVSRGGLKLEKALDVFALDISGQTCLDVGASTGGFTDCMLQHGARKVYAVDVGYGQLDYTLRNDARVVCMERYNARNLQPQDFEDVTFASVDVSFISLKLIVSPLFACLQDGANTIFLVKPQFEAGRAQVGKNGVVRDLAVRAEVCVHIMDGITEMGYAVKGLSYSPITGPKGNVEFLLWAQKANATGIARESFAALAKSVVHEAENALIFGV